MYFFINISLLRIPSHALIDGFLNVEREQGLPDKIGCLSAIELWLVLIDKDELIAAVGIVMFYQVFFYDVNGFNTRHT